MQRMTFLDETYSILLYLAAALGSHSARDLTEFALGPPSPLVTIDHAEQQHGCSLLCFWIH